MPRTGEVQAINVINLTKPIEIANQNKYTKEKNPETFPVGKALTEARGNAYTLAINAEKRSALQGIVQEFIILIISALVFLFHSLYTMIFHWSST